MGGSHAECEELRARRLARQRRRRRFARARTDDADDVIVGLAPASPDRQRAAGLGHRGREGDERRVKFTMLPKHPSAPPGTFDAVRDGLVDLSFVTASYTPARHILPLLPELPGSGDTALVNSVAYSRVYWKHFHKVGEYKGVKLLGVFTHGPGQMFTKKPVRFIADVQGLKIRTGGGVAEQVAKALGASAFVKPAPESYELLSSGVADGVFFPLESIISFKLDPVLAQ